MLTVRGGASFDAENRVPWPHEAPSPWFNPSKKREAMMFDPKAMLDALVGATSRPAKDQTDSASGGPKGAPSGLDQTLGQLTGHTSDQLLTKARDVIAQNPKLAQATFLGLVGLMFGKRKSGGVTSKLAKLGGLAVIGGLAYKAYQGRRQAPSAGLSGSDPAGALSGSASGAGSSQRSEHLVQPLDVPEASRFHPVSQTEDDAMLYLRAMVAAAACDGQVDAAERARIVKGMTEAGIDPAATRWLDEELSSPADVEELAAGVDDPEKAAQVYAAARIAIDPDTMQEREFLRQLAESLDLDETFRSQIEETIGTLRQE